MKNNNKLTIWTIGHSTRTLEEFIALLKLHGIEHLVDVRSIPGSRTNPQFNKESFSKALKETSIQYTHLTLLGGRRGSSKEGPSKNTGWEVAAFRNYADYAFTKAFKEGLSELVAIANKAPTAIMCSEAVWWRCHRRIITDYLLIEGIKVLHIMSPTKTIEAEMTPFAKVTKDKDVIYPTYLNS